MFILHLVLAIITIILFVVILVCSIKNIAPFDDTDGKCMAVLILGGVILITTVLGIAAHDNLHYREVHEPDWEDYKKDKAEMQTLVNQNTNDTIQILTWKGRQKGKR